MQGFNLEYELSKGLARFVAQVEQTDSNSLQKIGQLVEDYFGKLINANYTREQLYKIANGLTESTDNALPEDWIDAIRNYETGLTGFCAASAIIRVPGDVNEPQQNDELAAYVRDLKWTADPTIKPVN